MDISVGQVLKCLPYLYLTLWLVSDVCYAGTGSCPQSVRQWWGQPESMSKVYQQCLKEWTGWCTQQGVPNNAISAPKLANFLVHLFQVGLAWHTIGIYCSAISAFFGTSSSSQSF